MCDAAGIDADPRPAPSRSQEAIDEAFGHKPSMLQDVLARRRTEVDVLNGGIAAEGRRVGVPDARCTTRWSRSCTASRASWTARLTAPRPGRPASPDGSGHDIRNLSQTVDIGVTAVVPYLRSRK